MIRVLRRNKYIIATLFEAESLGLQSCLMRGDAHIVRVLAEFWRRGGTLRWLLQPPQMQMIASS